MQTLQDKQPSSRKREEHLSKDGKWRSFPKVPHLLQYIISGNYFGKVKINDKTIRQSLQTSVWSTAQLRLNDFLKEQRESRNKADAPKFSTTVKDFKQELETDKTIKPKTKEYRLLCLQKIESTWPELWSLCLDEITSEACKDWAAELNDEIASHYYNNTIGTLRQIIDFGIKTHQKNGGKPLENPAAEIKRVKIKQKNLRLPEPSQFQDLVTNIRTKSGGWGPRAPNWLNFSHTVECELNQRQRGLPARTLIGSARK